MNKDLTPYEYDVLCMVLADRGQIFTKRERAAIMRLEAKGMVKLNASATDVEVTERGRDRLRLGRWLITNIAAEAHDFKTRVNAWLRGYLKVAEDYSKAVGCGGVATYDGDAVNEALRTIETTLKYLDRADKKMRKRLDKIDEDTQD